MLFALSLFMFAGLPASAEITLSIYGGWAFTRDTDLEVQQPNGTNLVLANVPLEGRSLESPLYYGLRASWFQERTSSWGVALDFAHAKVYARPGDLVEVSGARATLAVKGTEPVGNTLQRFNNSHGLNFLTLNLVHRWAPMNLPGALGSSWSLQPYAGIGGGVTLPHVEATAGASVTDDSQFGGGAGQAMAGFTFENGGRWVPFVEYKLNYARVRNKLSGGGEIQFRPWTQHFALGVGYRF